MSEGKFIEGKFTAVSKLRMDPPSSKNLNCSIDCDFSSFVNSELDIVPNADSEMIKIPHIFLSKFNCSES
jgi:hypothetical protein